MTKRVELLDQSLAFYDAVRLLAVETGTVGDAIERPNDFKKLIREECRNHKT